MHLEKVILSHFRNYERQEITFSPGLNCIEGGNAEGKSSLLEALYLISTGRSFRAQSLAPLIQEGTKAFQVDGIFSTEGISHTISLSYSDQGRKARLNATNYTSFLPLLGTLPCVLLTPEDISIIAGAPAGRRRFLDIHISQMDPLYVHHLGRYHKAMKQRNALLKKRLLQGLEPWEQIMAHSASYLLDKRIKTVSDLLPYMQNTTAELSQQKDTFSWKYENTLKTKDPQSILESFEKHRSKEALFGSTLVGPHRDDIHFLLQDQEVKTYSSEGQKRTIVAALRLAEWQRLNNFFNYTPLFGTDDFGVHLDAKRSFQLQTMLTNLGQVFITAPSFPKELPGHTLRISQGSAIK